MPFEELVGEILQNVHHSYVGVVLKRMMLRAAERVALMVKAEALITGESLAQVSSQTLTNLGVIDQAIEGLVLQPLITYDKQDIINTATNIGTYEFAASMPEYCALMSNRPTAKAQVKRVEKEEVNFSFEVLEKALANASIANIDELVGELERQAKFTPQQQLKANDVVVDVRTSNEQQKKPLNLPCVDILIVPFFQLNTQFLNFNQDRNYLLYCEHGVISQLHALCFKDQGFKNVDVYQPKS